MLSGVQSTARSGCLNNVRLGFGPGLLLLQEHGEKKEIDMSRRRRPEKREILPDPKFGDEVLSKFMNSVMLDGKKAVAEGIVYGALDTVEAKAKKDPLGVFHEADRQSTRLHSSH